VAFGGPNEPKTYVVNATRRDSAPFGACMDSFTSNRVTPPCQHSTRIWPVNVVGTSSILFSTQCGSFIADGKIQEHKIMTSGFTVREYSVTSAPPIQASKANQACAHVSSVSIPSQQDISSYAYIALARSLSSAHDTRCQAPRYQHSLLLLP